MGAPWHRAWEFAKKHPSFIDLTDSRFHQNGLLPDKQLFADAFSRWLQSRSYEPDSRGSLKARESLSEFYRHQTWQLNPDDFILTAGTSEAYALIFSTLANSGDSVLLPNPGYPLFDHIAKHSRLDTEFYDQPASLDWQPDVESLERAVTARTRFVVLISPNNPTGQTVSKATLDGIAAVCRRRNLVLIVDEVFDACWEGLGPLPRSGQLFPDVKTLTLNGISKRFGSPDLKLAWIAVSGPPRWKTTVSHQLELANDTFLSANDYSQFLLPDLFSHMESWQLQMRSVLADNRALVRAWLDVEPRVHGVLPHGGIHGLWQIQGLTQTWDDEALSIFLLQKDHLSLHPGFFYELKEPGVWLVYSLLKSRDAFSTALKRLAERVKSL